MAKSSGRRQGSSSSSGFTPEQLEQIIAQRGLPPLKEKKPLNILDKVGRFLNYDIANIAGAAKGAINPNISILEGMAEGRKRNIGFSEIIKEDIGINPESRAGKIGVGAAGFLADVVFSPLTYLSFGASAGLKVGGKVLTKTGTKLAQRTSKEIIDKNVEKALAKGMAPELASRLAGQKVSGVVNDLLQRSFGKKGLTDEAAEEFLEKGISEQTLYTLREMGPKLIDQGGIKFFGKTLVTSKTLGATPVGRAAKRLGETEIVTAMKNTLGKTFVPDFMKNPKLVSIIDKAKSSNRRAINGIIEANKALFEGLDDDQMSKLFERVWEMKRNIVPLTEEIEEATIKNLNDIFPELKVKDAQHARNLLNGLEDRTLENVSKLRKEIDEIIQPYFEKRKEKLADIGDTTLGKLVGSKLQTTPAKGSLGMVDELNRMVDALKAKLKDLRSGKPQVSAIKRVIDLGGEITDDEAIHIGNRLIGYEEERLAKVIDELEGKIENVSNAKTVPGGKKIPFEKITPQEQVILAERKIVAMQKEFSEQEKMLQKILNARREAKSRQSGVRLIFKGDEKLQAVSDQLFEGKDSIIERFAKAAGLSKEDAIKFYIPSKFKDKVDVKDFAWGRNMGSPKMGFLKEFTGYEDNLIRDPFEAYSRGQVDVVTARIKTDAFKITLKSLGRPLEELSEDAARRMGMVKVGRETMDGRLEGWFPKEVAEEINQFLDPKKIGTIDELARVTGFDYVTGLFKGYVTSLFPGFHIRNITSNQFQNVIKIGLDTANPLIQKNALEIAIGKNLGNTFTAKTGQVFTNKQIREMVSKESDILEKFSSSYGSMEHLLDEANPRKLQRLGNFNLFNPFSRNNIGLKAGRKIGGFAEAQAKMVSILQALNEGKTVKEGIQQAEEAIFNYAKLTDMEQSLLRRIIPFYTFARKNAEFQIRMLATNPGRVATELKAVRSTGQAFGEPLTDEDKEGLPNWMIDSLGIKAGANQYGQQQFLTGFGLPVEEFIQRFAGDKGIVWNFFKTTLSSFNPLVKFPIEKVTGIDIFRDRPIVEITNGQNLQVFLDALPKGVGNELKDLLQYREIPNQPVYVEGKIVDRKSKYVANPFALHLLRNIPTSRILSTTGFLTDEEEATSGKLLKLFTGVKGFNIDQENQKFYKELNRSRELIDYLTRMGVMKTKEIPFIPKGK